MNINNITDINKLDSDTVITVGMFDGVHAGHRHLLSCLLSVAAERSQKPLVVTFDCHPRMVVNPDEPVKLLSTYDERIEMLGQCGVEELVVVHFDRTTAGLSACEFTRRFLVSRLGLKTLLLGYDNMFGSRSNNDFDLLPQVAAENGFDICRDGAVTIGGFAVSSTKIRTALMNGDIATATAMLGRCYKLSGCVVHGRHIGTTLGFPTANVVPSDSMKLMPCAGVYAVRASVDGKQYKAMANLGAQPTFHNDHPVLEVHLLGFDGDLYGKHIEVEFVEKLRDIVEFGSADELSVQLSADKKKVELILQ